MKRFLTIIALFAVCLTMIAQTHRVSGDVDGDGIVTSSDITALYNHLLNGDMTNYYTSDVDGDGGITSADVTMLYNILLGIIPADDNHEYVDLGLPSGTLWATMNIGANSPEEYGDYFAWGETQPKVEYSWDTYEWGIVDDPDGDGDGLFFTKYCTSSSFGYNGFTDGKTELDPEDDAATVNWGSEWRMPSSDQIQELIDNCTIEWTTKNGVNGRLFTSNINGASLFLPAAGHFYYETHFGESYYWSRSLGVYDCNSKCIDMNYYGNMCLIENNRCLGISVRAVRVSQNLPTRNP